MVQGKTVNPGQRLSWAPVLALWPLYLLLTAYTIGVFMMAIQGAFLLQAHGITSPSSIGVLLSVSSVFGAAGGLHTAQCGGGSASMACSCGSYL